MDYFNSKEGILFAENRPVSELADLYGTPLYIYSKATIERHWQAFDKAADNYPHLICYAVKANSNIAILNLMARMGSGFDIVSGGELARVLEAGGDAAKVIFSGVGKTVAEMEYALNAGIRCFNVESEAELLRLNEVAGNLGKIAPISLRVNPDIDAGTHPYISTGLKENKFGVTIDEALRVYQLANELPNLKVTGLDCHIGSQLTELSPFIEATERMLNLIDELGKKGITIHHLDMGGGLGVCYNEETPPEPQAYVAALTERLKGRDLELILEPGRAIIANAGILVTKVEYLKLSDHKNFAIVDAAMNDLLRPSLYSAWQKIIEVNPSNAEQRSYDIVGPICETGDFLGKNRELSIEQGDLLAVRSAGAYGFSMSSNYNSRPRCAEVMVDDKTAHLIRQPETVSSLWQGEAVLPE